MCVIFVISRLLRITLDSNISPHLSLRTRRSLPPNACYAGYVLACMVCFINSDQLMFSREFASSLKIVHTHVRGCTPIGRNLKETVL